jgi:predicted DNA binding CopG/RHH family protein
MNNNLNKEERNILESFENDEWQSVSDLDKRKSTLKRYAKNTLLKNKRVNIRISERDMTELRKRAVEEGLPYQTLISSILHKYINGSLVSKS